MRKIIIDTMGADNGSLPIIKGTLRALGQNTDFSVIFVGDTSVIEPALKGSKHLADKIEIIHTTSFVSDTDLPTCVFGGGDDTSMVMSMKRLKEDDEICAMISAGNTGALLVGTICRVGLLGKLRTPALATALPCKGDSLVCLTDCGANTDCTAEDLKRFAVMGNAYMQSLLGIENPKVALMSVGKSAHKGNPVTKEAYTKIEKLPLNFIGNIEGNDIICGEADVIVTDGFTGNILLKSVEAAGMAALALINKCTENPATLQNIKEGIYNMFAFNDRGGAVFLGTKKPIVKMHGCANEDTAFSCINLALSLDTGDFSTKIEQAIMTL